MFFTKESDLRVERQIAALTPPADKAAAWPAFRTALDNDIRDAAAQYHAALASNDAKFSAAAVALKRDEGPVVLNAEKVGFTNTPGSPCGALLNELT